MMLNRKQKDIDNINNLDVCQSLDILICTRIGDEIPILRESGFKQCDYCFSRYAENCPTGYCDYNIMKVLNWYTSVNYLYQSLWMTSHYTRFMIDLYQKGKVDKKVSDIIDSLRETIDGSEDGRSIFLASAEYDLGDIR